MKNPVYFCVLRQFAGLVPLLAWLLVWSGVPTRLEAAYRYPIGIPAAWIDPEVAQPARPADWSAEVPGYYCVDIVNGTNSGRTWGTPSAPRQTIPPTLGPGTRCEVVGTYSPGGTWLEVKGEGTAGAWVANTSGPAWLVGADAEHRASLGGQLYLYGRYLCVEYLDNLAGKKKWQLSTPNIIYGNEAKYMLIRNCEIAGVSDGGEVRLYIMSGQGDPALKATNIVIYKNHIHDAGPVTPADQDIDADAIMVSDYCNTIHILDNELHDIAGSGVGCSAAPNGPSDTHHIYIGRNHIYNTWGVGIGIKTSDHVVISQNTVHDIKWTSWTEAKCIGFQYAIESIWVIFNHCYNGNQGIKGGSVSGPNPCTINVIGNVVHDINPVSGGIIYPGITVWQGANRNIIGNTVYNCAVGLGQPQADTNVVIENNIISGCSASHIYFETGSSLVKVRNNILYQGGGAAVLDMNGRRYTVASANALANMDGLIEADPLFVNLGTSPTTRNLATQSASIARDAGLSAAHLSVDVYAMFLADFGRSISVDYVAGVRPSGGSWDIGAYNVSSLQTGDVSKPTGLRVKP